jgi:hypothetical protein
LRLTVLVGQTVYASRDIKLGVRIAYVNRGEV